MKSKESQANYIKKYRLKMRILSMLQRNNNCLFLTFTFRNSVLKNTSQETRKRYIKAYLNDMAKEYILNIDFGNENKREHYHAIATPKYEIFLYDIYNKKYGFVKGEPIGQLKRFTNINKSIYDIAERLTNHATKETTQNFKIIYSRPNKALKESKYKNEIETRLYKIQAEKEHKRILKEMESYINEIYIN